MVGGSGRAKLDGEVVELSLWDVLRVAPAVVRTFEAGPEGLDVIYIGGRKPDGGDTERLEDPWAGSAHCGSPASRAERKRRDRRTG